MKCESILFGYLNLTVPGAIASSIDEKTPHLTHRVDGREFIQHSLISSRPFVESQFIFHMPKTNNNSNSYPARSLHTHRSRLCFE